MSVAVIPRRPSPAVALAFSCGFLLLSLAALVSLSVFPAPAGRPETAGPPALPPLNLAPGASQVGALTIVALRPAGDTIEFGEARVAITFSRPIVASSDAGAAAATTAPASLSPAVAGEWRWVGSTTVEFVPTAPLPYATRFTVSIPAGLRAIDGSTLAEPTQFSFLTPPPAILSTVPAAGFRWATPTTPLQIVVNQPVNDLLDHVSLHVDVGASARSVGLRLERVVDELTEQIARSESVYERDELQRQQARGLDRRTRYELRATGPLPLDSPLTLRIESTLSGAGGLRLAEPLEIAFRSYGPLTIRESRRCGSQATLEGATDCPYGPLLLVTSNEIDLATLKTRLKLIPAVELDWDQVESYGAGSGGDPIVAIPGKFLPYTAYRVEIASGVRDLFDQSAPAFVGAWHTTDVEPDLSVDRDNALLEVDGDGQFPVRTVNISSFTATIFPLSPRELAIGQGHLRRGAPRPPTTAAARVQTIHAAARRNAYKWHPIDLRAALSAGQRSGLFHVQIDYEQAGEKLSRQLNAQLSGLAVHAKLGGESSLVWVTQLGDAQPVDGASVEVLDDSGTTLLSGRTDADGLVRLPGLSGKVSGPGYEALPRLVVAARRGAEQGVTLAAWGEELTSWRHTTWDSFGSHLPLALGTINPERGVYRPGDEVILKGLVRLRRRGQIETPPANTKALVTLTDSRGTAFAKVDAVTSRFGTFVVRTALPQDAALGSYSATATLELVAAKPRQSSVTVNGSFRVEEYRPPQFLVDVTGAHSELVDGDRLAAAVDARYLFGGALAGATTRWSVIRSSTDFAPAGHDDYQFGAQVWWWDDGQPSSTTEVVATGERSADSQGHLAIDAGTVTTPGGRTWSYTVEAEASDVNRQRVAGRTLVTVHPAQVYAGVRSGDGFWTSGKPALLQLIATDWNGALVAGRPLHVRVLRREWKWIRKREPSGDYTTISEPVEEPVFETELRSATDAAVNASFTPNRPGLHLIEATVSDRSGRSQTTRMAAYVVGDGWVSWQQDENAELELVADRNRYAVGETARILIKNPFPRAEALITVEREGVISTRRQQLSGAAPTVDIPLGDAMIPNIFVSVLVVRGRVADPSPVAGDVDPGRPQARVGYLDLTVEKRSKQLHVAVAVDSREKQPRETVNLRLQVDDWQGHGTPAELTVWAVDEAVLRLTDYQPSDIVEAVHQHRPLLVRTIDSLRSLLKRRRFVEKGGTLNATMQQIAPDEFAAAARRWGGGGGDRAGSEIRSRFKTTAFFVGDLLTDSRGAAQTSFVLPDNLTTYRVMVLAIHQGDRFGTGAAQVVVSKPLLALPALPRFARVGDHFEAGVVVHARSETTRHVTVRAEADGLVLRGAALQEIDVDRRRPQEVRFDFDAERDGAVAVRFFVSGAGDRDAVEQKLPVQQPTALETVALYGDTTQRSVEALARPRDAAPDAGGLEIQLSSSALAGYDGAVRQLLDYPYGCAEQLSSRLVPFIVQQQLAHAFRVPLSTPAGSAADDATTQTITRTIQALERLQSADGGFRYWPSSDCSSPWGSSYVVLALSRAVAAGYPVAPELLARGRRYLAEIVAPGLPQRCHGLVHEPTLVERVFALWVLARVGSPHGSYYGELFDARAKLPLFARAMLADMLLGSRDATQRGQTVLTELLGSAWESAGEIHFQEVDPERNLEYWSSDTRTTAIALLLLAARTPDHPYVGKLSRWLAAQRDRSGGYRTTQEAAFVLLALAELLTTKELETPNFTATVALADTILASETFRGRSLTRTTAHFPLSALRADAVPTALTFTKQGRGVLYYSASLRYRPLRSDLDAMERGITVQRWLEPWQETRTITAVAAGSLVKVKVRIATPAQRRWVVVDVPLPAGLEPVDTSLATTAQAPGAAADDDSGDELESPWAYRFWDPFNHRELHDDRLLLFADELPAGIHEASFVARATTPGQFVLLPARASEMYTPELFGRSAGTTFRVLSAPRRSGP